MDITAYGEIENLEGDTGYGYAFKREFEH